MKRQIILLPKEDYWAWVRASAEYVLTYKVNLTSDPGTAARSMTPSEVVTFPRVPDGYPEVGDVLAWFEANHPEIRLDSIEVTSPEEWREALHLRIERDDRFGERERPFRMVWPTDYAMVTQRFGANPQIYSRFGLPGHEGLDIRAPNGSNIYCCADGEVYQVHTNPKDHPYGIHVRVRHAGGYRTVYAHLSKPMVKEGDTVKAGEVVGKADSTGASTGSHLHLTLKLDGASERSETNYPKDILDPTPFLTGPKGSSQGAKSIHWPAGKCLIGAHVRVGEPMQDYDMQAVEQARLEAVKVELTEKLESLRKLQEKVPGLFVMVRLGGDFSQAPVRPQQFLEKVEAGLRKFYRAGYRYYEVHACPNLQRQGWQRSWGGGAEFSAWFREVIGGLRENFPDGRFGFPGLAPGGFVSGQRADVEQFVSEAEAAIADADWVGVNSHWIDAAGLDGELGGRAYQAFQAFFPDKLLFITEFNNPSAVVPAQVKTRQYLEFFQRLRDIKGLGAAFFYAISNPLGHPASVWRPESEEIGQIPGQIGARAFV